MILDHIQIGVGTWAWGDQLVWDFHRETGETAITEIFHRSIQDGVCFFACSESFSEGYTERKLGELIRQTAAPVIVSTKYVPHPWRMNRKAFLRALKGSLDRMGLTRLDLYELMPPQGVMKLNDLAECAAEALDLGLIREIGLSNYSARQIDIFNENLGRFGYSIGCLETCYNLLQREIETNGVLNICSELNIPVVAQNPLAMGYLCGTQRSAGEISGARRKMMEKYATPYIDLLMRSMDSIAAENGGRSHAQVALNWLLCRGVIPIPGARKLYQVIDNNQTSHWRMTSEQAHLLDEVSLRINRASSAD